MRRMQKVLWSKGILLNPQHLQLQDGYLEDVIAFHLGSAHFAPWGFSRLEIDQEALAGGTLALTSAAGIFPDGLPFLFPGADLAPVPRPLQPHWRQDQTAMDVFLAVPEFRPDGQNVSMQPESGSARFVAEAVLRRDETTGLAERPLQLARRNLRLVVQGESVEGVSLLQVGRLVRTEAGDARLDPHYVPPLLDLSANPYLMSIARRLVEILSARSSSLAGLRRQRNRGLADFGASDVASFWLLYSVNTHLPVIRHLFENRRGHPELLYRAMLELAGALTTFSETLLPRDLPRYDHLSLGECFTRLDATIRQLLETVVPTNHVVVPLRQTEQLVHAAALDDDRYFAGTQIYLGVSSAASPDEIARRAPHLLKVSSGDQVGRLIQLALPGVSLRHAPAPPGNMPVKVDYQYFQLERAGGDWDAIRTARNLAAYVPSDFADPKLELVVLLPPA